MSIPSLRLSRRDDPKVVRDAATEDYSRHVAPLSRRSSRLSLNMAWIALFSSMFWFVLAGTLALAVGTVDTLIALALAVVVFGAVNYVVTRQAARSGLTAVDAVAADPVVAVVFAGAAGGGFRPGLIGRCRGRAGRQ